MNKIKTVLDREPVNSDFIQSKQDFDEVLDGVRAARTPLWKSSWFFGVVGTACIVMTISVVSIDSTSLSTAPPVKAENKTDNTIQKSKSTVFAVNQNDTEENEESAEALIETSETPINVQNSSSTENSPNTQENRVETENEFQSAVENTVAGTRINYYGGMFPKIGGVYTGSIKMSKLCSGVQIETDPDYAVVSFKVGYYDGAKEVEKDVRGSYFPAEICQTLGQSKTPEMITLTKIKAEHRVTGKTVFLNSMNIEATPD